MTHLASPSSRRRFLGQLTAGAAATAVSPAVVGAADKPWTMKLSTSTVHFGSLPVEDACARIAALGFEAVDVWCPFGKKCKHLDEVATRLGAEGLKKVLAQHNLKLYAFSVYRGGYPKYAELLGQCGGGVAIRGSSRAAKPAELTAKMKAFIEALKPQIELAEKHNGYLAIENHGNALLHTHDSLKAFVDNNPHERLGIALAPYHLQSAKVDIAEAIRTVGKQLFFFYAWQRQKGVGQLPGHGPADCTPWIKALADVDYRWYVNPFMHHEPEPDAMAAALTKSKTYLEACYTKAMGT